jgi:SHS2 domain-containing protein
VGDSAQGSFEYFDVEADLGVIGRGPTLRDAFAQTGLAVFAVMVDLTTVEERDVREVRAHGETLESLLVNWVNECLYVHDLEGFVARRVELPVFETEPQGAGVEALRLHSFLHGEEVDRSRHRVGTVVKAATFHGIQVGRWLEGFATRLIVDI